MDRHQLEDDLDALPPQDIVADMAAGLDDLKHGRSVPSEVVLSNLDAKIAAWKARKAMLNRDGEGCTHSSTSD